MKHLSSLIFTIFFTAVLGIFTIITLSAFWIMLPSSEGLLPVIEVFSRQSHNALPAISEALERIKSQDIESWSSVSDLLSATMGISVALAGSLVAIYLAHRAYSVSQRQSDFEVISFIEGMSERSADAYWELSKALSEIEGKSQSLIRNAIRHDINIALERSGHQLSSEDRYLETEKIS